eukprot:5203090-Prorocentrum_lima.AAC.1
MTSSLVGSEMCIRDSAHTDKQASKQASTYTHVYGPLSTHPSNRWKRKEAVSYTHLTLPTICSV